MYVNYDISMVGKKTQFFSIGYAKVENSDDFKLYSVLGEHYFGTLLKVSMQIDFEKPFFIFESQNSSREFKFGLN